MRRGESLRNLWMAILGGMILSTIWSSPAWSQSPKCDLTITKTHPQKTFFAGGSAEFVITVINASTEPCDGTITVEDDISSIPGVTYTGFQPSTWSHQTNPERFVRTGALAPGESWNLTVEIELDVDLEDDDMVQNCAEVSITGTGPYSADLWPNNNYTCDCADVGTCVELADFDPSLGAVGWWPGNGNAADVSGWNNHGVLFLASYGAGYKGVPGTAFDFGASAGAVEAPDDPSLDFEAPLDNSPGANATVVGRGDFSIDAWIHPTAYPTASSQNPGPGPYQAPIVDKRFIPGLPPSDPAQFKKAPPTPPAALTGTTVGYYFYLNENGGLGLILGDGDDAHSFESTGAPIPLNQWTHVAVTVDRSINAGTQNNIVTFYVNAVPQSPLTFDTPAGGLENPANLRIGYATYQLFRFTGRIDQVEIFDRALGTPEIELLYFPGKCEPPCDLDLDIGTGVTATGELIPTDPNQAFLDPHWTIVDSDPGIEAKVRDDSGLPTLPEIPRPATVVRGTGYHPGPGWNLPWNSGNANWNWISVDHDYDGNHDPTGLMDVPLFNLDNGFVHYRHCFRAPEDVVDWLLDITIGVDDKLRQILLNSRPLFPSNSPKAGFNTPTNFTWSRDDPAWPSLIADVLSCMNCITVITENSATQIHGLGFEAHLEVESEDGQCCEGDEASDLSIEKAALGTGDHAWEPGGTGQYKLTVTNNGPGTVSHFIVDDVLPVELTYQDGSQAPSNSWSCYAFGKGDAYPTSPDKLECTYLGTPIPVGGTVELTFSASIESTASDTLTNCARVYYQSDLDPSNDESCIVYDWYELEDEGVIGGVEDPINQGLNEGRRMLQQTEIGRSIENWYADLKRANWIPRVLAEQENRVLAERLVQIGRRVLEGGGTLQRDDLEPIRASLGLLAGIASPPRGLLDTVMARLSNAVGQRWDGVIRTLAASGGARPSDGGREQVTPTRGRPTVEPERPAVEPERVREARPAPVREPSGVVHRNAQADSLRRAGRAPDPSPTDDAGATRICGVAFQDVNGNGVQERGEEGLPNWRIGLSSGGDPTYAETGPRGEFCFEVGRGRYEVRIYEQPGWEVTTPSSLNVTTPPPVTDTSFGLRPARDASGTSSGRDPD